MAVTWEYEVPNPLMPRPRRGAPGYPASKNLRRQICKPSFKATLIFSGVLLALGIGVGLLVVRLAAPSRSIFSRDHTAVPLSRPAGFLALVVDDAGSDFELAKRTLGLSIPVTLAVLPYQLYSKEIASEALKVGQEIILHLPMEPENYSENDPGPGALLSKMDRRMVIDTLRSDLKAVPGIRGVNNHMGSRLTADPDRMTWILAETAAAGLFFLDSRTTPNSVIPEIADRLGTIYLTRDVFLDADPDPQMMEVRWKEAIDLAASRGWAVIIAHVHPGSVVFLEERVSQRDWGSVAFVSLSTLLKELDGGGPGL